jgi:hypothetical protein
LKVRFQRNNWRLVKDSRIFFEMMEFLESISRTRALRSASIASDIVAPPDELYFIKKIWISISFSKI